jgi:hypothetical protein
MTMNQTNIPLGQHVGQITLSDEMGSIKLAMVFGRYRDQTLAVELEVAENVLDSDGDIHFFKGEPWSSLTVCLGHTLQADEILIKSWSENEPIIGDMLASGYFEPVRTISAGWISPQVWRMTPKLYAEIEQLAVPA